MFITLITNIFLPKCVTCAHNPAELNKASEGETGKV